MQGMVILLLGLLLACSQAHADDERLRVMAVGDIMMGTDFPDDRLPPADGDALFRDAGPILLEADIAIGNLEGVLLDGGEPAKRCNNPSRCYVFRTPARYAHHLAAAGFDAMSLANNHAMDFGQEGVDSSIQALDSVGIQSSGPIGHSASWEADGRKIALLAFAPNRGVHSLHDVEAAREMVRTARASHDLVVVAIHAGAEGFDAMRLTFATEFYVGEDRGNPVAFSRAMIDAGADLVIGHGPHVPRALEVYRGHLIAYSLGNFCTYQGISVAGEKGLAPILDVMLDGYGHYASGRIHSLVQQRPDGPVLDSRGEAVKIIRHLTQLDFPDGDLVFEEDGEMRPRYYPGLAFRQLQEVTAPAPPGLWEPSFVRP